MLSLLKSVAPRVSFTRERRQHNGLHWFDHRVCDGPAYCTCGAKTVSASLLQRVIWTRNRWTKDSWGMRLGKDEGTMSQIMTGGFGSELPRSEMQVVFHLSERNRQAEKIIKDYALGHAAADVAAGILGTFIPGGGFLSMVASIAAQAPLVYQPMSQKLASVYRQSPDRVTQGIVQEAAIAGAGLDIMSEFAVEFMTSIAGDLIGELGMGGLATLLPFVGGIAAAGLDAVIAATLTWRVGTMVSIYFQHGGCWIGSQRSTYDRAKTMVGHPSLSARVNLDNVPGANREILDEQMKFVKQLVFMMHPIASHGQIRTALADRGVPAHLVDQALAALCKF